MYGEESQPHSSLALRRAEALLISQSIPEVREVELKTKADIEGKKQQLKQLVGNSYRQTWLHQLAVPLPFPFANCHGSDACSLAQGSHFWR